MASLDGLPLVGGVPFAYETYHTGGTYKSPDAWVDLPDIQCRNLRIEAAMRDDHRVPGYEAGVKIAQDERVLVDESFGRKTVWKQQLAVQPGSRLLIYQTGDGNMLVFYKLSAECLV